MKKYLLNSAVITTPGTYDYRLITADEARRWYDGGRGVESTIGYQETADALAAVLGEPVAVNRRLIRMEPGDQAIVFRLTVRLADPAVKGRLGDVAWILAHSEIGILTRTA